MLQPGKKFLLNASNLHVGGGIQVAVSLIHELSCMDMQHEQVSILASDEVHANLQALATDLSRFASYEVFNTHGLSTLLSDLPRKVRGFDVVFTVFGPLYAWPMHALSLVGFAQPWIVYPNNELYQRLSFRLSIKTRLVFLAQTFFFKRADRLIVELEHVRQSLCEQRIFQPRRIDVVHNCLNAVYLQPTQWRALARPLNKRHFSIGFLGRDYLHKNTSVLPEIKTLLRTKHDLQVDFYVTFTDAEWLAKDSDFRNQIQNMGVLDVAQCPSFYAQLDAVVFPSLLECFSATPLEAMAMSKPLFASDRSFVRDVCGDFAYYFNPKEASSAAGLIANYIHHVAGQDQTQLAAARAHVLRFSNPSQRAKRYLQIMQEMAHTP